MNPATCKRCLGIGLIMALALGVQARSKPAPGPAARDDRSAPEATPRQELDQRAEAGPHHDRMPGRPPERNAFDNAAFWYRNGSFGFSFSYGCRGRWPEPRDNGYHGGGCRPRPPCPPPPPVIIYLHGGLRLFQPRIHGHPAMIQRWCPYRGEWVTVRIHPSIY